MSNAAIRNAKWTISINNWGLGMDQFGRLSVSDRVSRPEANSA